MNYAAFYHLALLIELPHLPGEPQRYTKPVSSTQVKYLEYLENHSHVIYPVLAVTVIALVALGIILSLRTDEMDGLQKAELKREVIRKLRREVYGMTTQKLAEAIGLNVKKSAKLFEEMAGDGTIELSGQKSSRVWRVKGLTG